MPRNGLLVAIGKSLGIAGLSAILAVAGLAQSTETVLHTFTWGSDGGFPFAGLSFDAKGNLYGVTDQGGIQKSVCCGGVFQLTPKPGGGWNYRVIHRFTAPITQGEAPSGSVVFDAAGNLYGTTQDGGYCGNVYKLSPTTKGEWKETVIHEFNDYKKGVLNDGCIPSSYLIFDQAGNLYGTTQQTGFGDCMTSAGCGTVFELSPAKNGLWTESIIHRFPQQTGDGSNPYGGLVLDSAGNLWGTTLEGGIAGGGTVFGLTPATGGTWNETVAFNFTGNGTGYTPYAGLVIDSVGNLYGTTYNGGSNGYGTVFEMTPQAGGQLSETLIHEFTTCTQSECPDGIEPFGGLVFDGAGNLYGTTMFGGGAGGQYCNGDSDFREGCGTVFRLTPGQNRTWDYSVVFSFPGLADGSDGAILTDDHLAVDANGNIFGTTFSGGDTGQNSICPPALPGMVGCGVVFEITQ